MSINAFGPRIKRQEHEDGRICKLNGIKIKNPEGLDNAGLDDLKDDLYIQKKKGIKKRFTLTSTRSGSVHVPNLLK